MSDPDLQTGGRDDCLLGWRQVRAVTGLSRTTAWRLQNAGEFPRPVPISPGRVGWWQSELDAWKAQRVQRKPFSPPRTAPLAIPSKTAAGRERVTSEADPPRAEPPACAPQTHPAPADRCVRPLRPVERASPVPPIQTVPSPRATPPRRKARQTALPGQFAFDF